MNILYEDSMPYGAEFFGPLGNSKPYSHQTIQANDLADIDYLLVRSTTRVDENLLSNSPQLKFVSTATAGTNHMDKAYLQSRDIAYSSAAGCNAVAVAEYVLSAMVCMAESMQVALLEQTVGIVGAGHVGSALAEKLDALGMRYKLCDPPLQEAGDSRAFVSLDEIMQCDVITLHTPLVTDGPHPTLHMFDESRLACLGQNQLLINACRGEVLDNQAALRLFEQGKKMNLVLDVWEDEPDILLSLVPFVALATAHIAGHTIEGKARGTEMLYQQVCELIGCEPVLTLDDVLPASELVSETIEYDELEQRWLSDLILSVYDIRKDSDYFRQTIAKPGQFAYIRKHYAIRREFAAKQLSAGNSSVSEALYRLGFSRL